MELVLEDWIYLYYLNSMGYNQCTRDVLEDWIYLYYLNEGNFRDESYLFLRIEFICIIWTCLWHKWFHTKFLRIEFICIIWTPVRPFFPFICSWGLNLFVLFEQFESVANQYGVLEDWIYLYYLNKEYGLTEINEFLRIEFICIIWWAF